LRTRRRGPSVKAHISELNRDSILPLSYYFFPLIQTLGFFTILTPSEQSKLSLEDMKAQKTELERDKQNSGG
jgi:hypothetical protein